MTSIEEKEKMTSFIEKILVSLLMLSMGILFCINIIGAVSITIGVILCVYGFINLIIIVISRRPLFSVMGIINAAFLALGIAFCVRDLAAVVVSLIPFILSVFGLLMLIDGTICFFFFKQRKFLRLLLFYLLGSSMHSLGISLLTNEGFRNGYSALVFGIILCISAFALLTYTLINRKLHNKSIKNKEESKEQKSSF